MAVSGHMAHSSGKVLVSSPQTDPRVNTEVDLDTGSDPLHTCTIQAVSGQVLAVVQVRGALMRSRCRLLALVQSGRCGSQQGGQVAVSWANS